MRKLELMHSEMEGGLRTKWKENLKITKSGQVSNTHGGQQIHAGGSAKSKQTELYSKNGKTISTNFWKR